MRTFNPSRSRRALAGAVGALAAAGLLAACGSSSDTAGSGGAAASTGASSTTAGSSSATTTAASASTVVADCKQTLAQAKEIPQFRAPGDPIDASKLKGKKVTFVALSMAVPTIADAANKTVDAAKAVGIDVSVFDAKGDVSLMNQGINQAISQKQDAIILLGIPTNTTAVSLAKAKAAGIPVVAELNNEPNTSAPGQGAGDNIYATTAPSYEEVGRWMACKAIVDTDGKAKTVIFGSKELEPAAAQVAGIREQLKQCPDCTVAENSTPVAQWQTALPGLTQSTLRSNPDVNYLLPLYDGMGIFVTAGVQQAGAGDKVKVAAFNGTPPGLDLVKKGPIMTADPGQSPGWLAWGGLDQAMRGMLRLQPGDPKVPLRFFDKENLQGADTSNQVALFGGDYKNGFEKLWGVAN